MTMKLFCMGESGNAYKAALTLELSGLEWEPVFVDFFGGETRSPEFRANVNEMGEAPVLVDTEHDYSITQSGAIQDYVVHLSGKLTGATPEERREVLRWILWDNHKLSSQIGVARFLMCFLPPEKRNADVIAFMMGRAKAALKILDARLSGRDWIVGDAMTTADLTCIGYIYYLNEIDVNVSSEYPNIARWADRIAANPRWKHPYDLMPGHPIS